MENYVDFAVQKAVELLAIDSPTGYTAEAEEFVLREFRALGFAAERTAKGGILIDLGGENADDALLLEAHADTLGGMVAEIKGDGRLRIVNVGGMNANNAEAENCRVVTKFSGSYEGTLQLINASIHVNGDYASTKRSWDTVEVVLAFGIVDALRGRFPRFSRWATRLGLILVCLGLLLAAGTAGWVVSAGRGAADPEAQWVVVLGAGVNGTVPSQALRERLEAAQDYLARYPEAIAVLSGAQGDGEAITEAQCMYDWLTARGVDPARLRMETKATTTEENLRCSLDLIEAETGTRPAQIAVVSGEYHLLRAELLARRAGAEALGVPSYTHDRAFYCLMLAREVCGVWAALLF